MQHAARIKATTFFKADGGVNALKFSALTHKNAFFYRIFAFFRKINPVAERSRSHNKLKSVISTPLNDRVSIARKTEYFQ